MSDQEPTPTTPQATSDERPQQRTNQPEQQQRGDRPPQQRERDRGRRRHPQQNQPQQQQRERRPEPSLNLEELRELVELIAQYGFTDFELEREGIRVRLRREVAAPAAASSAAQSSPASSSVPTAPLASSIPPAQTTPTSSPTATPSTGAQSAGAEPSAKAAASDEELHMITSPIVGTFYRSASPTAEPFVRLGSHVDPDSVVCIIEAMKLMNEIQAETSGEVVKIYVENGQPVEYGQPLFGIKK